MSQLAFQQLASPNTPSVEWLDRDPMPHAVVASVCLMPNDSPAFSLGGGLVSMVGDVLPHWVGAGQWNGGTSGGHCFVQITSALRDAMRPLHLDGAFSPMTALAGEVGDPYGSPNIKQLAGMVVAHHASVALGMHLVCSYQREAWASLPKLAPSSFLITATQRWRQLVLDPQAPSDVDTLTETVESLMDQVAEDGPESIDLTGLTPASVNCEHLAALLRASSSWKDQIVGWGAALHVAQAATEQAGLDPEDVLFGMI